MTTLYLAGPEVFTADPLSLGAAKRAICARHGLTGLYPMDQVQLDTRLPKPAQGLAIYDVMERALRACDGMIVNLTPFHGPSMDVGSAVELGFMRALGRPVFGYSNVSALFPERVTAFWGGAIRVRPDGNEEGPDGMMLEAFDLTDNLMIDGAIARSTGVLITGDVPAAERYTSLVVFEACVAAAARWFADRV
jgi:nucleoside 2-deoxyribosyltransferase